MTKTENSTRDLMQGAWDGSRNPRDQLRAVVLIAACALTALAVPVYWLFADPPAFLDLEKRFREEWPALTSDALLSGQFGQDVETWMADAMPLRPLLVGIDSYVWFLSGRQAARDVIRDAEGALVEAPPDVDTAELRRRLDKFAAFSQSTGIDTVLLIPPNAGYVPTTLLPAHVRACYLDNAVAVNVWARLGVNADGLSFVNLSETFRGAGERLFYRTDHHWNGEGAYTAYAALAGDLGFAALPREAFDISGQSGFYGSTYAKSGLWLTAPDTIDMWAPPCEVSVTIGEGDAAKTGDSLFFTDHLRERDMYPVFLDGIYSTATVENLSAGDAAAAGSAEFVGGTLLVVQDSYANSLIPLLIPHYDRIVAVDLRYYRNPVSELAASSGAKTALVVYSMDHIANDPDILWLR